MKKVIKGTNITTKDVDAALRVYVNIKTSYDRKKREIIQTESIFHICNN